ncbi:MAG: hypothetical protein JWL93_194 [Hyphomicrobiales bacterium]|nr:hypothetical protein [Hyphomicrobiales bacterium]
MTDNVAHDGADDKQPTTFAGFRALGYRVIPIIPPDAKSLLSNRASFGKRPGIRLENGYWGDFHGWQAHEATDADHDLWQTWNCNIGIRTGAVGDGWYLVLIDADTPDPDHAATVQAKVEAHFGANIPKRVGKAPKAGYPLLVQGDLPYTQLTFGDPDASGRNPEVEILTGNRQFVAYGTHPSGAAYHWQKPPGPLNELPRTTIEGIEAFMEDLARVLPKARKFDAGFDRRGETSQSSLKGPLDYVRWAVGAIPNRQSLFPRREWLRIAVAIKAALADHPDEALDLFEEFSDRLEDGAQGVGEVENLWDSLRPPFKLGANYLYDLARKHSGGAFGPADPWFQAVPDEPEGAWCEPLDIFGDESPEHLSDPPGGSLPQILECFAQSEARRKGVSLAMASAAAVGTVAAAIGSSVTIRARLLDDGFTQPAALWFCLVAEPGSGKSPILNSATKPLVDLDAARGAIDRLAYAAWEERKRLAGKGKGKPFTERPPRIRRSIVDDITMESLIRTSADNPHGLLHIPDELTGFFASFGAYKNKGDGDRSKALRMFEGREITVDRISSGYRRADKALMGILAGTQPEKIRAMTRDLGSDGMLQRFIPIMDDGIRRRGQDEPADREAVEAYSDLVRTLAAAEYPGAEPIRLSPAAYQVMEAALLEFDTLKDLPGASPAWKGHVEKWGLFLPRLVLTFHATSQVASLFGAVDPRLEVEGATAEMAVKYAWFLLKHSLRFYETYFGSTQEANEAVWIAGHLLTRPDMAEVGARYLGDIKKEYRKDDYRRLRVVMRELEIAGWCKAVGVAADVRPTRWLVNPKIHSRFEERAGWETLNREAKKLKLAQAIKIRRDKMSGDVGT